MNLCSFYNDVNSIDEGTNKHISNQYKMKKNKAIFLTKRQKYISRQINFRDSN